MKHIIGLMQDPDTFGRWFNTQPDTWAAWRAFHKTVFALPFTPEELRIYRQCTGRKHPPKIPFGVIWALVGRRGGKSINAAFLVTGIAIQDHSNVLRMPGQVGIVACISASRRQAKVVFDYVSGFFTAIPELRAMIVGETADSITLSNGVVIEVFAADSRRLRGHTILAAILDESAFMTGVDEDSPTSGAEIVKAITPAMIGVPNALLIGISSTSFKRGVVWDAFQAHYGRDSRTLVWRAASWTMNPGISEEQLAAEKEKDPLSFRVEYAAQFRDDIQGYIDRTIIEECVIRNRVSLRPQPGTVYKSFVDPSGGYSDSMTCCVAHRSGGNVIIDALLEVPAPFNSGVAVERCVSLLREYGIQKVVGDNYGGVWAKEPFGQLGITYEVSEANKSELYLNSLPHLNNHRVELLDHPKLITQFASLERHLSRSGRDTVTHPAGQHQHDDCANAVAGCVFLLLGSASYLRLTLWEWQAKLEDVFLQTGVTPEEQIAAATSTLIPEVVTTTDGRESKRLAGHCVSCNAPPVARVRTPGGRLACGECKSAWEAVPLASREPEPPSPPVPSRAAALNDLDSRVRLWNPRELR
jgi:hypothetical protein